MDRDDGRSGEKFREGKRRERKKVIERAPGVCRWGRRKGEGENLLAFYVSNYMKDGITYPTDRPADPLHPSFEANQPTNTRPPLSVVGL